MTFGLFECYFIDLQNVTKLFRNIVVDIMFLARIQSPTAPKINPKIKRAK